MNKKVELRRLIKKLMNSGKDGEEALNILLDTHLQPYTFKQIRRRTSSAKKIAKHFKVPKIMVELQRKRFNKEGYV